MNYALLVIDMQNAFYGGYAKESMDAALCSPSMRCSLISCWKASHQPNPLNPAQGGKGGRAAGEPWF